MNEDLYTLDTTTSDTSRGMSAYSNNPNAVMTNAQFVSMLQTAHDVPNYYNNHGGHNLGQFDGQKYSFDCWNLIKTILSGWSPTTPGGTKVTGDVGGETLLNRCGVKFGQAQDFSQLSVPGTYLYMSGHAGTYVGDMYDEQGRHYNVIECTHWSSSISGDQGDLYASGQLTPINFNSDGTAKGVIYTYVSPSGQRRAYEGGRTGGNWANYGLLPWIDYGSDYAPPSVIGYSGVDGTTPVYDITGPISNSEYILRRQLMEPRLTPPQLYPTGVPVYEDDSNDSTYTENIGIDENGVVRTVTKSKRVKYDGRDMWYAPDGWAPFTTIDNASYVWSRFSEEMDPDPNNLLIPHIGCQLSRGLSIDMYRHTEDGYTRNVACALGAVMCFYNKKQPKRGFVCIVEKTIKGGAIITSEWDDQTHRFQLTRRQKRYGFWDFDDWVFQGFIHNPVSMGDASAESALETFCNQAIESVGKSASWIRDKSGISSNNSASAGLIIAIAKVAGSVLNIIIPNSVSVTGIGRIGVLQNMGTWVNGPANKEPGQPEVGDIVIIREVAYKKPSIYQGDLCGIVTSISGGSFKAVILIGNYIVEKEYKASFSRIAGYFRPDWERVDGTSDSVKLYRNLHGLYSSGTTIEDACAREVCYLKNNLPSIKRTDIRLSAINYTGLLSNMYSVFATSSTSDASDTDLIVDLWTTTLKSWFQENGIRLTADSATVVSEHEANDVEAAFEGANNMLMQSYSVTDITAITGINPSGVNVCANARTAYQYLTTTGGLSQAAAVGVLANIQSESSFNCAAAGDYMWKCTKCGTWNSPKVNICSNCNSVQGSAVAVPTSFGICQWHFGRGDKMKQVAGSNWSSNLTGQLDYLMQELHSGYRGTFDAMIAVPNTINGAMYAADIFVRNFEKPAHPDKASAARQAHAMTFWSSLVQ